MAFFIYPASVSQNCDKRIVPAAAKCMERFFLLQLQDAIVSGAITIKRKFENGNYGALMLESTHNYNKKRCLLEQSFLDKNVILTEVRQRSDVEVEMLEKWKGMLYDIIGNVDIDQVGVDETVDYIIDRFNENALNTYLKDCQKFMSEVEKNNAQKLIGASIYQLLRLQVGKIMIVLRSAMDKTYKSTSNKGDIHKTGSYTAINGKIDIVPTSSTVTAPVLLVGGPQNGKYMEDQTFNINVKVIPTMLKNFTVLEKDLLDDYFSKTSEGIFKRLKTSVAKKCIGLLRKIPLVGNDAADALLDDDTKQSKYSNEGKFVDASAFHKSGNSPNNYNYASNIVMFNKDDLTDPDDSNIFENRSAMVRLFRKGWSTFAMLDPVSEIMVFISSLDGGYMHYIPYHYMMESYGSKVYYGDDKKLKNDSAPFLIKRGNFNQFAKLFKKK